MSEPTANPFLKDILGRIDSTHRPKLQEITTAGLILFETESPDPRHDATWVWRRWGNSTQSFALRQLLEATLPRGEDGIDHVPEFISAQVQTVKRDLAEHTVSGLIFVVWPEQENDDGQIWTTTFWWGPLLNVTGLIAIWRADFDSQPPEVIPPP